MAVLSITLALFLFGGYFFWIHQAERTILGRLSAGNSTLDRVADEIILLARFDVFALTRPTAEQIETRLRDVAVAPFDAYRNGRALSAESWLPALSSLRKAQRIAGDQAWEGARVLFIEAQLLRDAALEQVSGSPDAARDSSAAALRQLEAATRRAQGWPAPWFAILEIRLDRRLRPFDADANQTQLRRALDKCEAFESNPTDAERRLWIRAHEELATAAESRADRLSGEAEDAALREARGHWQQAMDHCRKTLSADRCAPEVEPNLERVRSRLRNKGYLS